MADTRPHKVLGLSIQYTKSGFIVWDSETNVQIAVKRVGVPNGRNKVQAQTDAAYKWLKGTFGWEPSA